MTKNVKLEFNQAEKVISLSEKWFDLGGGLYAAKVDPESTKCFFKSSRAAGRAFIMVDTAARVITLTDKLNGIDSFNGVEAAAVKEAAGLVDKAEKIEPAKIENAVKLAISAYSEWTKQPEKGQLVGVTVDGEYNYFEDESAGFKAATKGFENISINIKDSHELLTLTPAAIDNVEELHNQVRAFYLLVEAEKALKEKTPKMKEFRAITKELQFFNIEKAARLFMKAYKSIGDISEIYHKSDVFINRNKKALLDMEMKGQKLQAAYMLSLLPEKAASLLGRRVVTFEAFDAQYNRLYDNLSYVKKYESNAMNAYESKQEKSVAYRAAAAAFQREKGDLLISDRELAAYELAFTYGENAPAPVAAEKETGFTAVTLDRKEIEQAPLSATKEKAVKALTTQKRPKSKSRARLDASRAAIKTLDKEAPDFTAFCKQINAGRKVPYSERNCALLYDQSNGQATQVKGFQSWKAAGRVVKKGSKALVIEAPKMIKGTDKNGEPYEKLICTPVCVFDISQTEELEMKEA